MQDTFYFFSSKKFFYLISMNIKKVYRTVIPRNVRLAEAPSYGLPINLYDKRSSGTEAYRMLADEVIENAQ